ncbi:MAG: hypothetical protein CK425_12600 [Parachlamydia sp.]|jgi:hypothetical protein|nr:MAG: hypothetical protein CK425_12600 [Parachlamydia sp.]
MKKLKKSVVLATVIAMLTASSHSVNADCCVTETEGCGYEECRRAPQVGPAIALGAIVIAAIIAVAIQNSSHSGHGHGH